MSDDTMSKLDEKALEAAFQVLWPQQDWNGEEELCRAVAEKVVRTYLTAAHRRQVMSADTWIEKQWAETDPRPRGELLAAIERLTLENAVASKTLVELNNENRDLMKERERLTRDCHRYASDAGERAAKLDAAEEVLKERLEIARQFLGRAEAAEAALAKARDALTGIRRTADHRRREKDGERHEYYFHTAEAALAPAKTEGE